LARGVVADDEAGRVLRVSPPIDGSTLIHQTSTRFIGDVTDEVFRPLRRLALAHFVGGRGRV
jgi:hypothetical protein